MKFPEQFRWQHATPPYQSKPGDPFGVFIIPKQPLPGGKFSRPLKVMANNGDIGGWDHVSASLPEQPNATPSWAEMCMLKDLFWEPEETVVQFHPPASKHVNRHNGCLHLWKCVGIMPSPPAYMV